MIQIYFAEWSPPIVCHSIPELDTELDRLHAATSEQLRINPSTCPLAIAIRIPGYEIDTGLGSIESFVGIQVDPCDGEFYLAVGEIAADGDDRMFYGAGQHSYWGPKNLLPVAVARDAVRYFIEHQVRSPALRWQDWADRNV